MRRTLLLVSVLALSGCAVTDAFDDARCKSYGFQPGTDGYSSCRMQLGIARSNNAAAARNAAAMTPIQPPPMMSLQPPQPVRTPRDVTCAQNGQFTNCSAF
jgi:hypothetical protein